MLCSSRKYPIKEPLVELMKVRACSSLDVLRSAKERSRREHCQLPKLASLPMLVMHRPL